MIIDAHIHTWDPSRASYPWLTAALHPLDRTLLLDDITPALDRAQVDRVVLVQAADNAGDTAVMRAQAERHPDRVAGIVAWLPLDDPPAVAQGLEDWASDRLMVGVRNLIHDRAPRWLSGRRQVESLGLLAGAGVPLDYVTADAAALAEIPSILDRHPDLRLVIDHLGKPPIGGTDVDRTRWRELLRAAAAHPRVHAKVSGLYPPAGDPRAWTTDDLRPFLDDALDVFGIDRLMYGSDWPIAERAGGHRLVHDALVDLTGGWSTADRDDLFATTATTFYGLPPQTPERTTA